MTKRIFFGAIILFSIVTSVSCESERGQDYVPEANILEVTPEYLDNSEQTLVKLSGFNSELNQNKLFINDYEVDFDRRTNDVVITIPEDTFSEHRFSAVLKFHNGRSETTKELFHADFPRFIEVVPKRVFSGEEIAIEGNNLAPNETTEILFALADGSTLASAEITYADEYTIKAIVPENATGVLFYKNTLGKEELPRVLMLSKIEVKK